MGDHSEPIRKIALAYSGGLDTSVILAWLKERYRCSILAFVADVGQEEDLKGIEEKARQTGADEVVVSDLRETFVSEFVFPAIQAHTVYEGEYLLGTALARPTIARGLVAVAEQRGADTLAHGATGKGNDQVRFELAFQALAPHLKILAPWRTWQFEGRSDLLRYARQQGIPVDSTQERPYSIDRNLMHTSYEGGILEDPATAPPEDLFQRTTSPRRAPDQPQLIELEFERGTPVALNGTPLPAVKLLEELNALAGRHGVGRVDLVENRMVGMKSRGIYETPGVTVLHRAHRALESLTQDREVLHLKEELAPRLAELIYYGFWFAPETRLLLELVAGSQAQISGRVGLELYKGNCAVKSRTSPRSLYDPAFATFEADQVYRQSDAEGFIRLNGLRLRIQSTLQGGRRGLPASGRPQPRQRPPAARRAATPEPAESRSADFEAGTPPPRPLWRGRFEGNLDPVVQSYTASIGTDRRLAPYDIRGTRAHLHMLSGQGIISPETEDRLLAGLDQIEQELESDKFPFRDELEDIHMNIEHRLREIVGESAAHVHAGRSRNDQVALDLKLFCREQAHRWQQQIYDLQEALLSRAAELASDLLPAWTHLQAAQPVSWAHYLLSFCEALERDWRRVMHYEQLHSESPLGAGALAGSTLPLDPAQTAGELGFQSSFRNSYDVVGDRDFVLHLSQIATQVMLHLSRLAEDFVYFSSTAVNWIELPENICTGSSMMPQKKNPDLLELIRGKTASVIGHSTALSTLIKGLPSSYHRDLQQDKEHLFPVADTVAETLAVARLAISGFRLNRDRLEGDLKRGYLMATDLAEYLVMQGLPFREAHQRTGELVHYCVQNDLQLEELTLETIREFLPQCSDDVLRILEPASAPVRREHPGSAGLRSVEKQIEYWKDSLELSRPAAG